MLALNVVVEVEAEGVSEVLASATAPQFGSDHFFSGACVFFCLLLPGSLLKLPGGAVPLIAIG